MRSSSAGARRFTGYLSAFPIRREEILTMEIIPFDTATYPTGSFTVALCDWLLEARDVQQKKRVVQSHRVTLWSKLWNTPTRHEIRLWLRLLHFDFDFYTSTSTFTLLDFAVRLWLRLTASTFHLEFRFERLSAAISWSVRDSLFNDLYWPLPPGGHSTKHVHKCRTNLLLWYYCLIMLSPPPKLNCSSRGSGTGGRGRQLPPGQFLTLKGGLELMPLSHCPQSVALSRLDMTLVVTEALTPNKPNQSVAPE